MQILINPAYQADVNHGDSLGRTPLHFAAASGNGNVMVLLLSVEGCRVDPRSCGGETPLMRAIQHGKVNAVRLLLERGANPIGIRNISGLNALDFARITRNNDIQAMINQVVPQGTD